jgi:hypothetical protein
MTDLEKKAWRAYCDVVGEEGIVRLLVPSYQEIVDAGIKALMRAVEESHG